MRGLSESIASWNFRQLMTMEGAAGSGLNGKARPGSSVDLILVRSFLSIHTYGSGAGGWGEGKLQPNQEEMVTLDSPKKPKQSVVEYGVVTRYI